ncbi:MAG TPA: protein kinase [Polyangia bacterium]
MTASAPFPRSGRFRERDILGQGSMGTVYRALDEETGREVALKALREPGSTALYHLKGEFRSLRDIAHPNLVELYDLVVDDEQAFFTMELVDGTTFLEHVAPVGQHGGGDARQTRLRRLEIAVAQLNRGISTLHAAGKLHRDIKPPNILVTRAGRVVLLDFGLATSWTERDRVTEHSELAGSLPYMSPEQIWGKTLRPSADWYSVGVLIYEALTGRLPFPEAANEMLARKERGDAPPPGRLMPDVPATLDALVMALLDPEPTRRPDGDAIERAFAAAGLGGGGVPVGIDPAAMQSTGEVFVGRARELGQLDDAFATLETGRPTLVRISGVSGIGKTELGHQFTARLRERADALIFNSRCHPQESVSFNAFDGIVDQLSQHLTQLPAARAAALEPPSSAALVRLFPVMERISAWKKAAAEIDNMEPRLVRNRALLALRWLLDALGAEKPVLLWIDDQQWSDPDSLVLLDEILQPATRGRLMLLLTCRAGTNTGADAPLVPLDDATAAPATTHRLLEIACESLDEGEARLLAVRLLKRAGEGVHPDHLQTIVGESGGSPFFIGQLAHHPIAASTFAAAGNAGPALFTEVIRNRVARLSDVERRIVEIVAVAGGPIDRTVALRAAGIGEAGRTDVARLARHNLIKTADRNGGPAVESYHDRIREAIAASVDAPTRMQRHLAIAQALEVAATGDSEALYRHWLAAGDHPRAAVHALDAARKAAAAFAFGQAAELFGRAAGLQANDTAAVAVARALQADALVNAGRCAEAAPLYLAAADAGADAHSADAAAELRRRAAESFLISGHIDQGVAVLAKSLPSVGVNFPATPRAALLSVLRGLVWLRFRKLDFRPRPAGEVTAIERLRVDMCLSASKGLMLVDSLRGAAFAFDSLRHALAVGEPLRVGEALVLVGGGLLAPAGGWMASLGNRLLARAAEIATQSQSPRLSGMTQTMSGQTMIFAGQWRDALRTCDAGIDELTARCRGVAWETNAGYMGAIRAVEELGHLNDYRRRCQQLLADADARGDVYARLTAVLYEALAHLAAGRPSLVRQQVSSSMRVWTQSAFSVQHLYAVRLEAMSDVYEDRPTEAWTRLDRAWPALKRSGLLRIPIMRIDALALRARVALALASADPTAAERWLAESMRDRRALAKERRPDTPAHACLLQAGQEIGRVPRAETERSLNDAIAIYDKGGMALWSHYARHRKGQVIGGDEGHALCDDAAAAMRAEGIADPLRWLAVVAPGRWPAAF